MSDETNIENRARVRAAAEQLYATHIEDSKQALARGIAVNAMAYLLETMGDATLLSEMEPNHQHGSPLETLRGLSREASDG